MLTDSKYTCWEPIRWNAQYGKSMMLRMDSVENNLFSKRFVSDAIPPELHGLLPHTKMIN